MSREALLSAALAAAVVAWLATRRLKAFSREVRLFSQRLVAGDLAAKFLRPNRGALGEVQDALESMARDLESEGRLVSQTLRKQERALQGMQDGVLICGEQGEVLFMNSSFRELLKVSPPSSKSYAYWEAFREPLLTQALETALKERRRSQAELRQIGGGDRFARAVVTPFDHPELGGGGAVALVYDQTEERRLERMRSEFVSNVSHELRTPLTAIKASLETLRDGAVDDPTVNRDFLDKAIHHSERLQELINDILSLSRIEERRRQGSVDTQAHCQLETALAEALGSLEESMKRHRGRLTAELDARLPALRIEPAALRQILVNLIENALKYGGAEPQVEVQARSDGAWVDLNVVDHGPGIPAEDQKRVFERFYRVDKARTRGSGGSGLGLAIVKHLAENHGASVGLDSREGEGCRFWVRVRIAEGV